MKICHEIPYSYTLGTRHMDYMGASDFGTGRPQNIWFLPSISNKHFRWRADFYAERESQDRLHTEDTNTRVRKRIRSRRLLQKTKCTKSSKGKRKTTNSERDKNPRVQDLDRKRKNLQTKKNKNAEKRVSGIWAKNLGTSNMKIEGKSHVKDRGK